MDEAIADRSAFLNAIIADLEEIAMRYFRATDLKITDKQKRGFDPVTEADKAIEAHFRAALRAQFPDDAVFGEEFANEKAGGEFEWVIDPIDGTRAFMIGAPSFATLIALKRNGKTVVSLVAQPFTEERFWGGEDGALCARRGAETALTVSNCRTLSDARLASTFPEIGSDEERAGFQSVASQVKLTRYGMDAYAYALLAMGHIDLVIEAGLERYDYEAPVHLVRSAGGYVAGWDGGNIDESGRVVAAATQELAEAAIALLKQIVR